MDILEVRKELKKMGMGKLLALTLCQRESRCLLNYVNPCPFFLRYQEFNFCVSELLHQGCQKEKFEEEDQAGHEETIPSI